MELQPPPDLTAPSPFDGSESRRSSPSSRPPPRRLQHRVASQNETTSAASLLTWSSASVDKGHIDPAALLLPLQIWAWPMGEAAPLSLCIFGPARFGPGHIFFRRTF
uniref:Uncharacterized protein n=1 Tax=Triticum urartu TaxID=4572 RepID=A0A8R7PR17_TRIUA